MALEITGKISQILPMESGEGKNGPWKKQFFILEFMDGNYPKKLSVSLWGEKTDMIRNLQPGSDVRVSFNVESREYNGRWYTDVKAWRIEASNPAPQSGNVPAYSDPGFGSEPFSSSGNDNDLPF